MLSRTRANADHVGPGVGAIESQFLIRDGGSLDLSEQQMVDCAAFDWYGARRDGCQGGWMNEVFDYALAYGVAKES